MPLWEFACTSCGRRLERLLPRVVDVVACPACGQDARRRPSAAVQLNPPTGAALRSHFRLYQEATQEIDHAHQRAEADAGHTLASPDLWSIAKSHANALEAAGESPVRSNPLV